MKIPKTKNGLACKMCKSKFSENLLVVGFNKKTAVVNAECFAKARDEQMGEKVREREGWSDHEREGEGRGATSCSSGDEINLIRYVNMICDPSTRRLCILIRRREAINGRQ